MTDYGKKKTKATKWIRFRIIMIGTVLALCFGVVVGRAVQLQVLDRSELSEKAAGEYKRAFHKMPRRGTIYDQNKGPEQCQS